MFVAMLIGQVVGWGGVIPSVDGRIPPMAPLTNRYSAIVPVPQGVSASLSWSNLTNAAKSTTATPTARKLLSLQAGTWTGSNAWPLTYNPWVDIDATGSEVVQVTTAPGVAPLIGDTDQVSLNYTTTNFVYGGRWRITNTQMFIVTESASKMWFLPQSAELRNDTSPVPVAIAEQLGGELHMIASDYLYNAHYDIFVGAAGYSLAKTTIVAPRAYCADTLIEDACGYTNRSDNYFRFGFAEAIPTVGAGYGGMFIGVTSNSLVHVDVIKMSRSKAYIGSYTTNVPAGPSHYSTVRGNVIYGFAGATNAHIGPHFTGGGPWSVGTGFILEDFTYYGPSNVDPISADLNNTLTLRNVTIRPGAGATNAFRPHFASGTIKLEGHIGVIPYLPKASGITISGPTSYP